MEDVLSVHAEELLGETGLRLLQRQLSIGPYRFDLLFEDRHGSHLIVEIQKGTLDRDHTYRILDYYRGYKERKPLEFVELMVVANEIPQERKRRLRDSGVAFREIPVADFLRFKNEGPEAVQIPPAKPPEAPRKAKTASPATTPRPDECERLRVYFVDQTHMFRDQVRVIDPGARFAMIRTLPLDGRNWFISFSPSSWGYAPSTAGIHWELYAPQKNRQPAGTLRLNVGVEHPLAPEHVEAFKLDVAQTARAKRLVPAEYKLFGEEPGQIKLLAAPAFDIDGKAAEVALTHYMALTKFSDLVAATIRDYDAVGKFTLPLRYTSTK